MLNFAPMNLLLVALSYFSLLLFVSHKTKGQGDNNSFFRAGKQAPWQAVALGMIGASLSGVSFVSVPGMVSTLDMTYIQMCIGFFFGYLVVAFVLLPLYYKLNLTSIYTYLNLRFGTTTYRTGASFFILSKMIGAATRLYLVCIVLEQYIFHDIGIPFWIVAVIIVLLIWLYTFRGGVRSIVWTDALQTLVLVTTVILIIFQVCSLLGFSAGDALRYIADSRHSRWLEWENWKSPQHFVKQFLSGIFIVIVMTGLDQDMMQKNLACSNLGNAQKNMCTYGIMFIPINFLFLSLGILLLALAESNPNILLPPDGDSILPFLCARNYLGTAAQILFLLGIIAAAFSSADSALTAITTSFCIDIIDIEHRSSDPEKMRRTVHAITAVLFVFFIILFKTTAESSIIHTVYVAASYTYGPLLGLYSFGLFTRRRPKSKSVPVVCIAMPVLCYLLNCYTTRFPGYRFGYELLMLNGVLTFFGLYLFSSRPLHKEN